MPRPRFLDLTDRGLSTLGQEVLPVLYRHRLLTAGQLTQLLRPAATSTRYLRRQLEVLHARGLVDASVRRSSRAGELLWYVTATGCEVVEGGGELTPRAYRMTEDAAASPLQEHTLAVNTMGIAFVEHARRLGDECGPLDWDPELAHRVRDGDSRLGDEAFLVPDAVLRYVHTTDGGGERQRMLLTFFCEIDRATMSIARLAAKLHAYARYARYIPQPPPGRSRSKTAGGGYRREAWRARYPSFPRVLLVLDGASAGQLAKRADDLRALASADARLQPAAADLKAGVTTLDQLQRHGPFAPIVMPVLGDAEPTDVLLRAPAATAA
ncbi:replication-relaxation family protein [Streptomyces pinistramenti]|uniref:replication-relaxation family protein n=1 Tax=Streptomyces pinistramenti TaxID=2884812 RepID=UPI001D06FA8C|nr:replication-relaxation family protein [Streptomyces pinistramenti]MCB5910390.1 replication-relaxation family protein [Streptomyces pinistramenti]